jgi:beta-galactosidase
MVQRITSLALACALAGALNGFGQTYTPDSSNRVTINLGATAWKMIKSDAVGAQDPAYNDAAGFDIGIPHCMAEDQTFVNNTSGGANLPGGPYWYRKHFTLDAKYSGKKVFLEFEGVHLGCQVYVNGTVLPTTSTINPQATHVIGFVGFTNDITSMVKFDGTNNVIAVRVAMNAGWFADPGFSTVFRFGQGSGGPFRPVWLHITDPVHVPSNEYSGLQQWGTYVATTSLSADLSQATVRILTNVQNDNTTAQTVTVTTKVVDASTNNIVLSQDATHAIAAGSNFIFDQTGTINSPKLWYPNNSPYGKPNLHKVYHIVKIGAMVVDLVESPLGIRTITWDKNFPYINGKKQCLYGASSRYDYPALGTAVPPAIQWRDAKMLADIGGNLWRPGHSTCSETFVEACDAFGIMIVQPSGEGEGAFSDGANATASRLILKKEIHRDMIIRDRSHPSILAWEASNGDMDSLFADTLRTISTTWDSLAPRVIALRGKPFKSGVIDLHGCTLTGCDAQQKPLGNNINFPWWGSEYWGRHSSRFAYDWQVDFCGEFLRDWAGGIKNNCFGMVQWYFMETPGETGPYEEGISSDNARSFGSSMTDYNRIPKYLYYQYGVCWRPYALQPRIAIANHWNRSGSVRVDVWSNCPKVRLSVNGTSVGEQVPNGQFGAASGIPGTLDNSTTQLPFQCTFTGVAWQAGTLKADGLDANGNVVCTDQKVTAGAPDHIVLTQEQNTVMPNGQTFNVTANGTDAALILATIVDANGNWCPTDSGKITWTVAGPATYRGGADQFVTTGQGYGYHAPLDPELNIEGGKAMVAVRSQFTTGTVTVSATATGLTKPTASIAYDIKPVTDPVVAESPVRPASLLGSGVAARMYVAGRLVKYYISGISDVTVEILNAHGQTVRQLKASRQSAGWHSVMMDGQNPEAQGRSAGVYFVKLTANGKALAAQKMVVTR